MKVIKQNDGNIALILTPEEAGQIAALATTGGGATIPDTNKLKGLQKNTIAFLEDVKIKFGHSIIPRNDKGFRDLFFKHKLANSSTVLKTLDDKKIIIIARTDKGNIDSIQLVK